MNTPVIRINKVPAEINNYEIKHYQLMNRLLSFLLCMLFFVIAKGQSSYAEAMQQGDDAFNKQQYKTAINKYFAAEAFDPTKKNLVKEKVNRVFDVIEGLRKKADDAFLVAKKLAIESGKQSLKISEALARAQKLIDAFYFYEDRFALAFKDNKFYFIDKNGDKIEKLHEWEQAEQFNNLGFAKVKGNKDSLLSDHVIDTAGNTYTIAFDIEDIKSGTSALIISNKEWDSIPPEVLSQIPLRVLIFNFVLNRTRKNHALTTEILKLENLEHLQFYGCGLTSMPDQIGKLRKLRVLDLSVNQIRRLPGQIGECGELSRLDLSSNYIDSLPVQIGKLENLIELNLAGNRRLKAIPEQIDRLKNLTILNLTNNSISKLPVQIGELQKLTVLYLGENQLDSLPVQIGQLKNLKELYLNNNDLSSLPDEIGNLQNLEVLDISYNKKLTDLPIQIGKLKKLRTLKHRWVEISNLDRIRKMLPNCQITW
jgi:hypothetical protein